MKRFLACAFLVLAAALPNSVLAQETVPAAEAESNDNLVNYYDSQLFQWDYTMFGGLTLNFKNQNSLVMFGIRDSMKKELSRYVDSNNQYRSYRGKTVAGNIFMWGGLAAVAGGMCVPAFIDHQNKVDIFQRNLTIGAGIMLGGFVSEMIGALLLYSGQENIFNAVNYYNRHKIEEYK